jgi:hypothetical protein
MEVEHLVPRSLSGVELREVLDLHGLGPSYDLLAMGNLAPSCGPCNRGKGAKPPPTAPVIARLLADAARKAPAIHARAVQYGKRRALEKSLAVVFAETATNAASLERLQQAVAAVASEVRHATGEIITRVHPAVRYLADANRWEVLHDLGPDVVLVDDGQYIGQAGTHRSWECPICGSHGPWSGNRCLNCGRLDPGPDS